MVTRRIDAFDPAVITIANVVAGTTNNIIPETATLLGTIRTVSEETRTQVTALARQVAQGIATTHGATVAVNSQAGYPPARQAPAHSARVPHVSPQVARGPSR